MKQVYCLFLFILLNNFAFAQNCLPDSLVRDSAVGVYPKPITPANPDGGIKTPACINKPFEFVLTIKISDTVSIPGIPIPVNLVSAKIDTVGAIAGLPVGMTYACNPPTCVFPKNTVGCMVLKGTPTDANTPGIYRPVITLTLGTAFGNFELKYPGEFFPGEYLLTLLDEKCAVSTQDPSDAEVNWFPTISRGYLYSRDLRIQQVSITDQMGRQWMNNSAISGGLYEFSGSTPDGIYFIHWIGENGKAQSQKIILQRN